MNPIRLLPLLILATLTGCMTVQDYRDLYPAPLSNWKAPIGASLFTLRMSSDLPNAYGYADIYGGMVDKGFVDVKLYGIDGSAVKLLVRDASRTSDETTLDRYGDNIYSRMSQQVNIEAPPDKAVWTIDTAVQKRVVFADVEIEFLDVQPAHVTYMLRDLQSSTGW